MSSLTRATLLALASVLVGGCSTLFDPYLDPRPLNNADACDEKKAGDCLPTARFKRTREAVQSLSNSAHQGYSQRARLNTISSALAYPVVGVLLYRGATTNTEGGRKALLALGISAGAAYEARNALITGSPESVYILAEARLGCLLDAAAAYYVPDKQTCDAEAKALKTQSAVLAQISAPDLRAEQQALVGKANDALAQYYAIDATIAAVAEKMQVNGRKIVADTNAQIRTPSISLSAATTFLKADVGTVIPAEKLPGGPKAAADPTATRQIDAVTEALNKFVSECARPQPKSLAPLDACTTYSPALPPPPTVTTNLPSTDVALKPGDTLTFVATSAPSGTPWASLPAMPSEALQSLGALQQVSLSPNQTQVSIKYEESKPVAADAKVVLSVAILGTTGNALPINVTLKAKAAAGSGGATTDPAKTDWAAVKNDADLMKKLGLGGTPQDADVRAKLQQQWRRLCGANQDTDDKHLLDERFRNSVKDGAAADPSQAFCK